MSENSENKKGFQMSDLEEIKVPDSPEHFLHLIIHRHLINLTHEISLDPKLTKAFHQYLKNGPRNSDIKAWSDYLPKMEYALEQLTKPTTSNQED